MNKKIIILAVLMAVLGVVYFLVTRKPWGNFKSELKDFAIRDTASITKIFLADKAGNHVLLQKNNEGTWMVNNKFKADMQKIEMVNETMHDLEIRNPLGEAEFNNTIAMMASEGIKVEFYDDEKLIKAIYVGSATPDHTGTFMMIEGSSTPFVVHIQGFVGYLTPRFNTIPFKWRSKEVFNYSMTEIEQVKVEYPSNPEQSFMVINKDTLANVYALSNKKPVMADPNFVKYYLGCFRSLYYEGFDEDISQKESDSIHTSTPYCRITVITGQGLTRKLQVNFKLVDERTMLQYDEKGKKLNVDTEKFFAFLDNEKEMVYIQEYNFGKLFKTLKDFESTAKLKKADASK